MIVKLSILGLLIVLIAVMVLTTHHELFADVASAPAAPSVPSVPSARRSPPASAASAAPAAPAPAVPATLTVGNGAPQAGMFAPSQGSDLSKGSILPPSLGAAGPAPLSALSASNAAATIGTVGLPPHQNQISDIAVGANAMQNKSDLLANIQKMIQNELLATRSMDTGVKNAGAKGAQGSPSLQQGREHLKGPMVSQGQASTHAAGCGGDSEGCGGECQGQGSAGSAFDISEYIKKDSIPCWGCSLDY